MAVGVGVGDKKTVAVDVKVPVQDGVLDGVSVKTGVSVGVSVIWANPQPGMNKNPTIKTDRNFLKSNLSTRFPHNRPFEYKDTPCITSFFRNDEVKNQGNEADKFTNRGILSGESPHLTLNPA